MFAPIRGGLPGRAALSSPPTHADPRPSKWPAQAQW